MDKLLFRIAVISGLLVVAIGAFGAHALESLLESNNRVDTYETAVQYQMFHTLAILILSMTSIAKRRTAGLLFAFGILVFSGSLYVLSASNTSWLGAITPVGGVLFIAGWMYLLIKN